MKAFTARFGEQEEWTEAILHTYGLGNKALPSARRVAALYRAVEQLLRDLE